MPSKVTVENIDDLGDGIEEAFSTSLRGFLDAAALPPYARLAADGWSTMTTSALAGLVVRPTDTAAFEIYNGYGGNGPSLIIDRLFVFNLVSTAVGETYSLWAGVTTKKAPVTAGAFAIKSSAGRAYNGSVIAAVSTTIVDPGWFPWTNAALKPAQAATVTPQGAQVMEVNGRLVVPPGCSLVLHTVSSIVGQTFTQGASWFERVLPNVV